MTEITIRRACAAPRNALLLSLAFVVCAAGGTAVEDIGGRAPTPRKPNVVLILLDDLGYGDLGVYGSESIRTPEIDRFAGQGMRFTRFYGHPVCTPSRVGLMTGQSPEALGFYNVPVLEASRRGLPGGVALLPDHFKRAGYTTGHVGKWHLGYGKDEFNAYRRFDSTVTYLSPLAVSEFVYVDPTSTIDGQVVKKEQGHGTRILTDYAIEFLRRCAATDAPFFLNLWYFAPHAPFEPAPEWAERYPPTPLGRFAALVSTVDEQVGRILKELDDLGVADDSIVVLASDNGGLARGHTSNGSLRGFKASVYEGALRVPLMVRWPRRIAAGSVNDSVVATIDLLPTLAQLVGLSLEDVRLQGEDVSAALTSGLTHVRQRPLFWELVNTRNVGARTTSFAVCDGALKYVATELDERGAPLAPELYDVEADPGERQNLASSRPEDVARLDASYRAWRRETGTIEVSVAGETSEATETSVTVEDGAYTFRAPGGRVELAAREGNASFDFHDGPFSLVARVRLDATAAPGTSTLAAKEDSWSLDVVDGRLRLVVFDDRDRRTELVGETPLEPGRWHDVAFTVLSYRDDPSTVRLYLDGELAVENDADVQNVRSNDHPVTLGNDAAGVQPFVGTIDALRLVRRQLWAGEI